MNFIDDPEPVLQPVLFSRRQEDDLITIALSEPETEASTLINGSDDDGSKDDSHAPLPDAVQERHWIELEAFYTENQDAIRRATSLDISEVVKLEGWAKLDRALDTFRDTAKLVSEGLMALGNVHPFIGVVAFAFHSIISLDISRRETDKKILAVKLQMQNMMCVLFRLRELRYSDPPRSRHSLQESLSDLMGTISKEIKQCGSDLSYYREKKFLARMVKAKLYERRFMDHIETFRQRRSEIDGLLTAYIAGGVEAALDKITEVGLKVEYVTERLGDMAERLFRRLDTAQEQATLKFIDQNGGVEECISRDSLLRKLLNQAGEAISDVVIKKGDVEEELKKIRQALVDEIQLNLTKAFEQNRARFEAMLKVQNNNLERISDQLRGQGVLVEESRTKLDELMSTSRLILEEGRSIKRAVVVTGRNALKDPVLQRIWERMGLKANVKAKTFVLGLRDHLLSDFSNPTSPVLATPRLLPLEGGSHYPPNLMLAPPRSGAAPAFGATYDSSRITPDEEWVMKYLDVLHVQPILEAMDEDGSGFISIKEANRFALSRPKDCSFLKWLGYWAAGWHINVTKYRSKIYALVREMHDSLRQSLFVNRSRGYFYLDSTGMRRLEMMLRSTKPHPDDTNVDQSLLDLAAFIAVGQEERILSNLKELDFIINSPQDARLVTGSGRIEASVYPLLYCLLKRHLDILKLSSKYWLDKTELENHAQSIENVFVLFDERILNLHATFSQVHRDVNRQFEIFAYGMFLTSHLEKDVEVLNYEKNTLLRYSATNNLLTDPDSDKEKEQLESSSDRSILSKPLAEHPEMHTHDNNFLPPLPISAPSIESSQGSGSNVIPKIDGYWTIVPRLEIAPGYKSGCAIEFVLNSTSTTDGEVESTFEGKGLWYRGTVVVKGRLKKEKDVLNLEFDVVPDDREVWGYHCLGVFDPVREVISGGCEAWMRQRKGDEEGESETEESGDENEATEQPETEDVRTGEELHSDSSSEEDTLKDPTTDPEKPGNTTDGDEVVSDLKQENEPSEEFEWLPVANPKRAGEFTMRRTPAFALRFLKVLDSPQALSTPSVGQDETSSLDTKPNQDSDARRRWKFVKACVLFEVQGRMNSKKAFKQVLLERLRYIHLNIHRLWTIKYLGYEDQGQYQWPDWVKMQAILSDIPPANARLYTPWSEYLADRMAGEVNYRLCDVCRNTIRVLVRHTCITCVKEGDLDYTVDLCINCLDKEFAQPESGYVNHKKSHSLFRVRDVLLVHSIYTTIDTARQRSTMVKAMFRALAPKEPQTSAVMATLTNSKETKEASDVDPFYCAACGEKVSLPCWICDVCDQDVIICMECDENHEPVRQPSPHSFHHALVRVSTSDVVESRRPTPATEIGKLDRRLEEAEGRINQHVEKKIASIQDKVESLEGKLNEVQGTVGQVLGLLQKLVESKPSAKQLEDVDAASQSL